MPPSYTNISCISAALRPVRLSFAKFCWVYFLLDACRPYVQVYRGSLLFSYGFQSFKTFSKSNFLLRCARTFCSSALPRNLASKLLKSHILMNLTSLANAHTRYRTHALSCSCASSIPSVLPKSEHLTPPRSCAPIIPPSRYMSSRNSILLRSKISTLQSFNNPYDLAFSNFRNHALLQPRTRMSMPF